MLFSADYNFTHVKGTLRGAANEAIFQPPIDRAIGLSTTEAVTWLSYPGAQAYYLIVGTSKYGSDLVNSGILPPTQLSYQLPDLATSGWVFATLLTEVGGSWRYQGSMFIPATPASPTR